MNFKECSASEFKMKFGVSAYSIRDRRSTDETERADVENNATHGKTLFA